MFTSLTTLFNVVTTTLLNAVTTTFFNAVDSQNQVGVSKGIFNAKNEVATYIFFKKICLLISIQMAMFLINLLHPFVWLHVFFLI